MQRSDDEQHLHLVSIFHYVLAGITALCGFTPIFHLLIGLELLRGGFGPESGPGPERLFGGAFAAFAAMMMLFMWTLAVLQLVAAGRIRARRGYTFCLIVAGLSTLQVPFGTLLGVFTIIVLTRESVRRMFDGPPDQPQEVS